MINKSTFILFATGLTIGCTPTKTVTLPEKTVVIDNPYEITTRPVYNGSYTRTFDLLHTKLDVKFDWKKSYLFGKAELTLTPYFHSREQLTLDARGMDIHQVALMIGDDKQDLSYKYDSLDLTVDLGKEYTRKDTFKIFIDYTSKPNELPKGGSDAIADDQGLYFINPTGEIKDKPMQIWTQGETESNSVWFPTIDAPNEKATQEIAITIENRFKTLSNGELTHQEDNGDGTRTDFWEMNQLNTPYLFMMAIGEYAIVSDEWRGKEVSYYVEPEYEEYARDIFGITPEMLEFFSNKLGVEYPWVKYNQVIVRDYVSGAMENTSAVIFGDFVQQTKREMLDDNMRTEDIVAHELFHHWFGDLVTCESWANLPLNESFATYGEVLWREYKYGDDKAREELQKDLTGYLRSAKEKSVDVVRFDYGHREEMFDGNTYQKGARILHMLRTYMGDDAFFESLRIYLEENKHTAVEMHQLRLACEKVSGEDLNWFFNQWFFAKGHPILDINYYYNDSLKTQTVTVTQMQDLATVPLYYLPIAIDIYVSGEKERKEIIIDQVSQSFTFDVEQKPELVNFDADKILLCEKMDNHNEISEWATMYYKAGNYLDRYEAVKQLSEINDPLAIEVIIDALSDSFPKIQRTAISGIDNAVELDKERTKSALVKLFNTSSSTHVQGDAIDALANYYSDEKDIKPVLIEGISSQSYYVTSRSLKALSEVNVEDAMKFAKSFEKEDNMKIIGSIASIYAEHGEAEQNAFFIDVAPKMKKYRAYGFVVTYAKYLDKQDHATVEKGLDVLSDFAQGEEEWWIRMASINSILTLEEKYKKQIEVEEAELKDKVGSDQEAEIREQLKKDRELKTKIEEVIATIKENEEDPKIKKLLGEG